MLKSLKKIFFPERDFYPDNFTDELHYQSGRIILPASLICVFVWLNYINVDTKLYPDEPLIIYCRYGLTIVSAILLVLQFIPFFKRKSMWLISFLGLYLECATGFLTGLSKADPVYMGGYLFVLVIPVVAPVRKSILWGIISLSLALFFSVGFYKGMEFTTIRDQYKLNDLMATSLFVFLFVYVLDRMRYKNWQTSRQIDSQKIDLQKERDKIASIVAEAKRLSNYVVEASEVFGGFSRNIHTTVSEQSASFQSSNEKSRQLIESIEKLKTETKKQLDMNTQSTTLTQSLREELNQTADSGKTASQDATKIKSLSDECDKKLQNARGVIEKLKDESSRIAEISNTINDIADKTNLLSLNASIESARAGEHGKGFAVVADEISKLADISISSAKEIGEIIRMSVNRISEASFQIQETSQALRDIITFLEDNRQFLLVLEKFIKSQDDDVQTLISHFENFLNFTDTIAETTDKAITDINESQDMLRQIEVFYINLSDMSNTLLQLTDKLSSNIESLQKTLLQTES